MSEDTVTLWLYGAAAVLTNIYFVLYLFRPWRSTAAGRALMVKALGNVILLNMVLAAVAWPDYSARPYVRFVGLLVFNGGLLYLIVVLIRTPRARIWKDRRNARDHGDRVDVQDS